MYLGEYFGVSKVLDFGGQISLAYLFPVIKWTPNPKVDPDPQ